MPHFTVTLQDDNLNIMTSVINLVEHHGYYKANLPQYLQIWPNQKQIAGKENGKEVIWTRGDKNRGG